FLLNILLDFGLTNYNTRNIAQHPQLIANHFGKILAIRFVLFFLYAFATLVSGWFIGYSGQEYYLLFLLVMNQFLVAIIQYARSNFAGLHLFKTDAVISILDRFLLIFITSALLWTNLFEGELKIEWFVYAQTVAYGLTALIAITLIYFKIGRLKVRLRLPFSLLVLRQSFPYALLILLMMMYSRIDAVMIERLMVNGDEAAGIYAQGFRYLDAVNMFALLFAGILLPIFARLLRQKESVNEITSLACRLLFGISVLVGISCFFFQKELIELRYENTVPAASVSFGLLILSFIPISMTYVFGTLLTANGNLKQLNQMAMVGVLLNVVLNYFLIQSYGIVGAEYATLITQLLTALAQIILAYRMFELKFSRKLIGAVASLPIGLVGIYYLFVHFFGSSLYLIIPFLLTGVVLAYVLGIFKLTDLKTVLSK
ncbi:MAG: polysaccharide biosynthesis C-terminal domain-containing protein, partial [Crocinitomix sp.]|nr:polysaccharide biosynthesis C-terminal domain-containing protein [Crocinitomix sp.]